MKRNEPDPDIDSSDDEQHLALQQEQKDLELARQLQESEGDDYEAYMEAYATQSKRLKHNEAYESDTDEALMDIDPLGKYALCCKYCSCPDKKVSQYLEIRNNCGNTSGGGNLYLYHRGCCHNDTKNSQDYLSPLQAAIESTFCNSAENANQVVAKPLSHLAAKYNSARTKEVKWDNEDYLPAIDSILETNPDYISYRAQFNERVKAKSLRTPLRVLDLFSGIGSAAIVLKKLKLPIHTIVHVEHDPVAQYVCQYNHKDDGINHVYLDTFEEVYGDDLKVLNLIVKHGPFDLVLAGAPCQNYSQVNAYRNKDKENAQYLPQVGSLIRMMDQLQEEHTEKKEKILFISENVVFQKSESIWPFYGHDEHGLCPVQLDAKDFSPIARNRFYWTNIPLKAIDDIKNVALYLADPRLILDKGYEMIESVLMTDTEKEFMPVKANTTMAAKSRIDDPRMMKVKKGDGDQYYCHTFSVREREKMSGLPVGYCELALNELFKKLTEDAFLKPENAQTPKTYKDFLDTSLWHFAKKCKFRFKTSKEPVFPFFQIEISAPSEGRKLLSYYDEEEYCKHLIGNGWSIPVVEHLLEPIRQLYEDDSYFLDYHGFNYEYPWPPYTYSENKEEASDEADV